MNASAKTSINKTKIPKLYTAVDKVFGWEKGTTNLDIGAGKYAQETTTPFLYERGVINLTYDPFNLPTDHNKLILKLAKGQMERLYLSLGHGG